MPEQCIKDYVASTGASVAHQPPNQTKLIKMKSMIFVALALVAVVAAAPAEEPEQIVRSSFVQEPEGSYNFDFETAKGINRQEEGTVKEVLDEEKKPHNVVVVRGAYSYPGEDGKPVSITYVADEFGYRAEGESIPKPARR